MRKAQQGQSTLTQYTRYLTIALGLLNATTVVSLARSGALFNNMCSVPIIPDDNIITILLLIITLTAGTGLIMWMGELVTEKGVGNGMSLLIFTSIVASFPSALGAILTAQGWTIFLGVIAHRHRHRCPRDLRGAVPAPRSRSSTPSAWLAAARSAGRTPTFRSRSTWPA